MKRFFLGLLVVFALIPFAFAQVCEPNDLVCFQNQAAPQEMMDMANNNAELLNAQTVDRFELEVMANPGLISQLTSSALSAWGAIRDVVVSTGAALVSYDPGTKELVTKGDGSSTMFVGDELYKGATINPDGSITLKNDVKLFKVKVEKGEGIYTLISGTVDVTKQKSPTDQVLTIGSNAQIKTTIEGQPRIISSPSSELIVTLEKSGATVIIADAPTTIKDEQGTSLGEFSGGVVVGEQGKDDLRLVFSGKYTHIREGTKIYEVENFGGDENTDNEVLVRFSGTCGDDPACIGINADTLLVSSINHALAVTVLDKSVKKALVNRIIGSGKVTVRKNGWVATATKGDLSHDGSTIGELEVVGQVQRDPDVTNPDAFQAVSVHTVRETLVGDKALGIARQERTGLLPKGVGIINRNSGRAAIQAYQEKLIELGYLDEKTANGQPNNDGIWGRLTRAATIALQQDLIDKGILAATNSRGRTNADGVWGRISDGALLAKLNSEASTVMKISEDGLFAFAAGEDEAPPTPAAGTSAGTPTANTGTTPPPTTPKPGTYSVEEKAELAKAIQELSWGTKVHRQNTRAGKTPPAPEEVIAYKKALAAAGYFKGDVNNPKWDDELDQALLSLQLTYDEDKDAVVGPKTEAALLVALSDQARDPKVFTGTAAVSRSKSSNALTANVERNKAIVEIIGQERYKNLLPTRNAQGQLVYPTLPLTKQEYDQVIEKAGIGEYPKLFSFVKQGRGVEQIHETNAAFYAIMMNAYHKMGYKTLPQIGETGYIVGGYGHRNNNGGHPRANAMDIGAVNIEQAALLAKRIENAVPEANLRYIFYPHREGYGHLHVDLCSTQCVGRTNRFLYADKVQVDGKSRTKYLSAGFDIDSAVEHVCRFKYGRTCRSLNSQLAQAQTTGQSSG